MRPTSFLMLSSVLWLTHGCSSPGFMTFHFEQFGGEARYTDPNYPSLLGSSVLIPDKVLQRPIDIQIGPCDPIISQQETTLGACVRFLPEQIPVDAPITLTVPYDPNLLAYDMNYAIANKNKEHRLTIGTADVRLDPENRTIAADVKSLGDHQPFAKVHSLAMTKEVDILFLIDNSPGIMAKQRSLATAIPDFIRQLDESGADYHIGIANSDIGTNARPSEPWGGNIGACDSYEGDDGVLQARPCSSRSLVTADARNACSELCSDDKYVPKLGQAFISKTNGQTNVPQDLKIDPRTGKLVDYGPINAFRCMAILGDGGCGVEGQLEGMKRALDGHRSENSGFLRQNSLLSVIFLTDEDDCSVKQAMRQENNPNTRDCDEADQSAGYDCYHLDYRCLARSTQCNEPMNTPGSKTGCKERIGNYLEYTGKYVSFLRSLRPNSHLLIGGFWTLPSLQAGGNLRIVTGAGGSSSGYLNRGVGKDASCFYPGNESIYGQAQFRLSKFAAGFGKDNAGNQVATEQSICEKDSYATALRSLADAISRRLKQ